MVTCYVKYQLDPAKIEAFEDYAKLWIPLVRRFGGAHHGYFLPHESDNDLAVTLFSFPSLSAYETYRLDSMKDEECIAAHELAKSTNCIIRYERQFLRPMFE